MRNRNLLAFDAAWLILSVAAACGAAWYLWPAETEAPAGMMGWTVGVKHYFNYKVFLYCFPALYAVIPLVHVVRREWAGAGLGFLLGIAMTLFVVLYGPGLEGQAPGAGILGFNLMTPDHFDSLSLLLPLGLAGGIYVGIRLWLIFRQDTGIEKRGLRLLLYMLGLGAGVAYIIALHEPLFHSTKFWIFEDDINLIESVYAFFASDEYFLGTIIILFTLCFPVLKLIFMFWSLIAPQGRIGKVIHKVLSILGKYSMIDVFIVALLLLNMKLDSDLLNMEIKSGVIWFSVSIILTMIISSITASGVLKPIHSEERHA